MGTANNVELADVPTDASWRNRTGAQSTALRYAAWRNRDAHNRRLGEIVNRANVA